MAATDEGQGRTAWIAMIGGLIVVATFVASKAARDAILLASFPVTTFPIFVAISALLSLPIVLVTGKWMARMGPSRLMPILNLSSAALAAGEWLSLPSYPRAVAVTVFFHLSISGAVLVSGFWSIINERFDVQAAKRHIGRIGMGATLGGILGGLIAEGTAVSLPANAILLVLAALQVVCAFTLLGVGGTPRVVADADTEGPWVALRVVTRSQLLRNVGIVIVLGAVSSGVLDYVFKFDIVASGSDSLLGSLAIFYTVTSVLAAITQIAICGPLIARLGVPRSVGTLSVTVTLFGFVALVIPTALATTIARGAELVTRNSIYRAGYELLYAPLPEADKRPTKMVLDVGAERIGDLLGAQLVGVIVFLVAEPRLGLLMAAVAVGALTVMFAIRLPRNYTLALEASLLAQGADAAPDPAANDEASWVTLTNVPVLGQTGEPPVSLRMPKPKPRNDDLMAKLGELRSGNLDAIRRALGSALTPDLAPHVIALLARDDVGRDALAALRAIAPHCTGTLVDGLLDHTRDEVIRRRLPAVLAAGEPALATWGLWRGLADPSFEVRYRCGAVLAHFAETGHLAHITAEDVFETVRRELGADPALWKAHRVNDEVAAHDQGAHQGGELEHVFTVLGLVLPPEPLRIALHAVQTDDSELRGTALEYLESILPLDVRAQLWPVLEGDAPRSRDEVVAALHLEVPSILEKLRKRALHA